MKSTIGSNHALIDFGAFQVLFSYQSPAGLRAGDLSCQVKHSRATSSHLNKAGFGRFPEVTEEELIERITLCCGRLGLKYTIDQLEKTP